MSIASLKKMLTKYFRKQKQYTQTYILIITAEGLSQTEK